MNKFPYNLSIGLWCLKDNHKMKQIYNKEKRILERIKVIGESQLFNGIELHYPYEVTTENFISIRKVASEYGLKIVSVIPGYINDEKYKKGSISSVDKIIRKNAINRLKKCLKMNKELFLNGEGGLFTIFWMASEGFFYPFEHDYNLRRELIKDALTESLDEIKNINIALENQSSFPFSKNYFGTIPELIILCNDIANELKDENRVGINLDFCHVLMENSFLGYELSFVLQKNILLHLHCNTAYRGGFDSDLLAGPINYFETMELFFWLIKYRYRGWIGFDVVNQEDLNGIRMSIMALQKMYMTVLDLEEKINKNLKSGFDIYEIYKYFFNK